MRTCIKIIRQYTQRSAVHFRLHTHLPEPGRDGANPPNAPRARRSLTAARASLGRSMRGDRGTLERRGLKDSMKAPAPPGALPSRPAGEEFADSHRGACLLVSGHQHSSKNEAEGYLSDRNEAKASGNVHVFTCALVSSSQLAGGVVHQAFACSSISEAASRRMEGGSAMFLTGDGNCDCNQQPQASCYSRWWTTSGAAVIWLRCSNAAVSRAWDARPQRTYEG